MSSEKDFLGFFKDDPAKVFGRITLIFGDVSKHDSGFSAHLWSLCRSDSDHLLSDCGFKRPLSEYLKVEPDRMFKFFPACFESGLSPQVMEGFVCYLVDLINQPNINSPIKWVIVTHSLEIIGWFTKLAYERNLPEDFLRGIRVVNKSDAGVNGVSFSIYALENLLASLEQGWDPRTGNPHPLFGFTFKTDAPTI